MNHAVLEQAFNKVVSRHEILRSTVVLQDGEPAMLLHESWPLHLKKIDLSALAGEALESRIKQLLLEEPERPFQLLNEPGIRVTVLELGPEDHVIILMMHHLVCDRASVDVVWREWSASYSALLQGQAPQLPALTVQHGDFALWQARQLAEGRFEDDLIFWQKKLQGAPPLLELPSDRPRREANRHAGSRKNVRIGNKLVKKLRESSQQAETTLFTLFTAALNVLLFRYCGIDDIVLGVVANNRDRQEFESAVGFLANIHALRTGLSGDSSFREVWRRVQSGLADLCRHQAAPFEEVINRVRPQQSLSFAPIVQVMMDWRDRTQTRTFGGIKGFNAVPLMSQNRTSKFDLTVFLTDEGDDVLIEMEYNTDLFDGDRMERMLGHYGRLLESIIKNPEGRIGELEILTEREREQVLVEWNRTEREYPSGKCVHELFEEQVRRTPEAVAVVSGEGREVAYAELNAMANQFAHHLRQCGMKEGDFIGVRLPRCLGYVVSVLGILKAGGAYVPLGADLPKERLEFMVEDCEVQLMVTDGGLASGGFDAGVRVIDWQVDGERIRECGLENPEWDRDAAEAAYVIYTSGSTGRPKGVVIPHRGVVRLVRGQEYTRFDAGQRFLLLAPTEFDASVFELWGPLLNGGACVIYEGKALDFSSLEAAIQEQGVTSILLIAGFFNQVMDVRPQVIASIQHLLVGGEALSVPHIEKAREDFPELRLTNAYGPTECSIISCNYEIGKDSKFVTGSVPIGRPLANTKCYILDESNQPVPVGVAGELHIGGDGLAVGYHNLPELTAERFILNPFRRGTGERLYKTGDLCRFLSDGDIEYLGRMDHQVKLRGFRIELGEIEAVLRECAGVKEAVVVLREEEGKEKRLVAYVVGEGMTVEGMREELRRKLPEYMMPAAYQVLERLPLTANGKVDRKGLPKPEYGTSGIEYIGPRNPTEVALAGIWCEILRLERVGIGTSFFEVGGTSLLAIQLADRIRRILKREIPVRLVFQNPTIEKMAALINQESMPRRKAELISWNQGEGALSLIFLVDDGSLGLFKVANLLDKRIPIDVSVSPLTDSDILAAIKKESKKIPKLPEMASVHVRNIRNRSHSGPVILVGHCFGGNLAFEVAQQLLAFGVRVETVVMLDTWMTNPSRWWLIQAWFKAHFSRIISHGPAYLLEKSRRRIRLERQALASHLRLLEEVKSNKKREFDAHIPMHLIMRIYRAAWVPKQKPLPLKGILLISRDDWMSTAYLKTDKTLGTQKWFDKGVEVLTVPGDHANVLEEHNLAGVADGLTQAIGRYFQSGSL